MKWNSNQYEYSMILLYSLLQTVQLRCKSLSSATIIIIKTKQQCNIIVTYCYYYYYYSSVIIKKLLVRLEWLLLILKSALKETTLPLYHTLFHGRHQTSYLQH